MRYPIMRDLRLNTKLRLDQRNQKDGSSEEVSARGSMALSYNLNRSTYFDVELGGQLLVRAGTSQRQMPATSASV